MKRAFLFPGQGSQRVGMAHGLPRRRFVEADAALGYSLSRIIDEGPEAELMKTANTQPALLAVSIAWADELSQRGIVADLVAGHSLGEYSALVYSGALSFADAIKLVHQRGVLMQAAVPEGVGAMAAVVGLDARSVADCCREASVDEHDACQPANYNGGGQVVVAGHRTAVERAMQLAKQKNAKLVKALPVSAPFHSALMSPAAIGLRSALEPIVVAGMQVPVVTNVTARANQDAALVKTLLFEQVTGSVRWEESMRFLVEAGVTEAIEVGPGNVLRGLMKRIAPTVNLVDLPVLTEVSQ